MLLRQGLKLELACEMHEACVEDNEKEEGVVKADRMAGWLSNMPTEKGLVPLDGIVWDAFPPTSSRLGAPLTARHRCTQLCSCSVHGREEMARLRGIGALARIHDARLGAFEDYDRSGCRRRADGHVRYLCALGGCRPRPSPTRRPGGRKGEPHGAQR